MYLSTLILNRLEENGFEFAELVDYDGGNIRTLYRFFYKYVFFEIRTFNFRYKRSSYGQFAFISLLKCPYYSPFSES